MCNIRRDPAGLIRARMVEPTHVRRARVRVYTHPPHLRLCICTYVRIDVPAMSVYISAVYTPKTSPLTPFAVVYIGAPFSPAAASFFSPLFSRFLSFSFSRILSFFLAVSRLPRRATTIHLSLGLIYDGETRDRVGNNVPGKKLRKEKNFLVLARSFLLPLARSPVLFPPRRISPFYFACLCGEKDSTGVSFLAGYREATGGRPETARGW